MKNSGDEYLDVLQNIEFGIIQVYRGDPSLLDMDAKDAVDALVRHYHAAEEQRTPPSRRLGERAEKVFQSVQPLCEFRLGNSPFPGESRMIEQALPLAELVQCLRKIRKSIPFWSERAGRRGYLDFVSQYVA